MSSPLSGIRVVDFTHVFAGPFATQIIGDMGADIVKVERIDGGDAARYYGLADGEGQMSAPFVALNRNKRSLALNLASDSGITIATRLIARSDVLIENFRPGVMQRLGLGYGDLAAEHPGLIYCSISGFGQDGPQAQKAANDLVMQAYSGLLSITGEPGRPPVRCGTSISDFSAGLYAAIGILGALFSRTNTGKGQRVETSILEAQVSLMGYIFSEYWMQGVIPGPLGTGNRLGLPNQAFPTSDGWVAITSANERMWHRCCEALGVAHLADDERFNSLGRRYANRQELVEILTAATRNLTTDEAVVRLEQQGVSCAPIQNIPTVSKDPQLEALGAIVDVPIDGSRTARTIGSPLHFSETPVKRPARVPRGGEDSEVILEELGFSLSEVAGFVAEGVVGLPEGR